MNLDESLRSALGRQSPSPGFRAGVMARIASRPRRRAVPRWRAAAAVLLVTGGAIGGWTVHRHREGERAREQVMLAFRIAGQKAHYAREEVRDVARGESR